MKFPRDKQKIFRDPEKKRYTTREEKYKNIN